MVNWKKITLKTHELAAKIARRAGKLLGTKDITSFSMDVAVTHTHGCPLKLQELLDADDNNFLHDVCGIHKHLNRDTGELMDCFLPRYAVNEPKNEIGLLPLTPLECDILRHRLEVPDAITEAINADKTEQLEMYHKDDIDLICDLLMAGKYDEAKDFNENMCCAVLTDVVEGSTFYGAAIADQTPQRLVVIGEAGKCLAIKISVFLNLEVIPEFPLY